MTNTDITQSFTPVFQFGVPNQNVILAKDEVAIQVDGTTYSGTGEVRLDLLPRAGIHIYAKFQEIPLTIALQITSNIYQNKIISFTFGAKDIPGFWFGEIGITDDNKKLMTLQWCPKFEPLIGIGDSSSSIEQLVFHLFNFEDVLGIHRTFEQNGQIKEAIEHIDLEAEKWRVELRSLVKTREQFKKLNAEGGYGITHVGRIKKSDGSSFTGREAEDILYALRLFFSFAKGMWCNPVCSVGFDNSNNRVWESWSSPKEPWDSPKSWFDHHHSEQLATLFPGFMKRWEDENWRKALEEVIYWCLNANNSSRGIDAGIILTQAAIERLAYEYVVVDRKLIEDKGFKDIRASDKFRLLFSSMNIPIDISSNVPKIEKLSKEKAFNWLDNPHALTDIRNSLVHPNHKYYRKIDSILFEAWNLGLWYLELAILRLCGYSGTYSNRLTAKWVGQVEDVPWVGR